jgi:CheY-like chemotaxis protein
MALNRAGHEGFYAETGEQALEILKGEEKIHIIFLDLNLPDMSGVELCRRIRMDRPNAVINAITGYAPFFDITGCYQAGFDDYLEKPISRDLLFTSIYKAFQKTKELH